MPRLVGVRIMSAGENEKAEEVGVYKLTDSSDLLSQVIYQGSGWEEDQLFVETILKTEKYEGPEPAKGDSVSRKDGVLFLKALLWDRSRGSRSWAEPITG